VPWIYGCICPGQVAVCPPGETDHPLSGDTHRTPQPLPGGDGEASHSPREAGGIRSPVDPPAGGGTGCYRSDGVRLPWSLSAGGGPAFP